MLENTTVTLPLDDFDRLRWAEREYKKIARQLSACFAYTCTENPYPQECEGYADTETKRAAIDKADIVRGNATPPAPIWENDEDMILKLSGLL